MLKEIIIFLTISAISVAFPANDLELPQDGVREKNVANLAVEPPQITLQDDDLSSSESAYGWGRGGWGRGYGYGRGWNRPYYGGYGGYGGWGGYGGYGGYGGWGNGGYRRNGWGRGYGYWG